MLLTDISSESFQALVNGITAAKGEIYLKTVDGTESYNLRSQLSRYIAIDRLAREAGQEWMVVCEVPDDEKLLRNYQVEQFIKKSN